MACTCLLRLKHFWVSLQNCCCCTQLAVGRHVRGHSGGRSWPEDSPGEGLQVRQVDVAGVS